MPLLSRWISTKHSTDREKYVYETLSPGKNAKQQQINPNVLYLSRGSECEVLPLIWRQWAALPVCLEVLNAPLTRCSLLLDPPDCQHC